MAKQLKVDLSKLDGTDIVSIELLDGEHLSITKPEEFLFSLTFSEGCRQRYLRPTSGFRSLYRLYVRGPQGIPLISKPLYAGCKLDIHPVDLPGCTKVTPPVTCVRLNRHVMSGTPRSLAMLYYRFGQAVATVGGLALIAAALISQYLPNSAMALLVSGLAMGIIGGTVIFRNRWVTTKADK
jgi:hypothetical protein